MFFFFFFFSLLWDKGKSKYSYVGREKKEQETPADPLRASVIRDYDRLPPEAQQLVRQYIDLLGKR